MQLSGVRAIALTAAVLAASSCDVRQSDVLGHAFVAPAQLNLRRELSGKSGNVAVLKHGEEVGVLDVRRRFVRIRSAKGMEGWVDAGQLLSKQEMERIRAASERVLKLPSQGAATVFEPLNMHIESSRQSPALAKIDDGVAVALIAHKLTPKITAAPELPTLIDERPQAPARRKKERQTRAVRLLPPPPKPPKPPENWQALSSERINKSPSTADLKARKDAEAAAKKEAAEKKPVAMEDWSLVRTHEGQSGWVLSRNLVMSIPDEVAQYAEGKRITSYFDLGTVNDEEKGPKHNWLWTTSSSQRAYDFDSWRVFLWNRHRHRYETSYRQRDVEGYYPAIVDAADANTFGRTFHLITRDDDGKYRRRTYVFDSTRVHLTNTEEYRPSGYDATPQAAGLNSDQMKAKAAPPSWFRRQWDRLAQRTHKPQPSATQP